MSYIMRGKTDVKPFDDGVVMDTTASNTLFTLTGYRKDNITETVYSSVSFHNDRSMDPVTGYRINNIDIGNLKSPKLGAVFTTSGTRAIPDQVTGIFCVAWGGGGGGAGGGYDAYQFGETADNDGDGGAGGGSGAVGGFYLNTNQTASLLSVNLGAGGAGGAGGGTSGQGESGAPGGPGGSTTVTLYNTPAVGPSFVSVTVGGGAGGQRGAGGAGGNAAGGAGGTVPSGNWPASPRNYSASGSAGSNNDSNNPGAAGGAAVGYNWYANHGYAGTTAGAGGRGGDGDPGPSDNGRAGTPGSSGAVYAWYYYDGVNRMV